MAYTNQQIADFIKAKGIGDNPNALLAFKEQYNIPDSQVDAVLGQGASAQIKQKSAYGGAAARNVSATDEDVARTLSGGVGDISDPYKLLQIAKVNGWSPEQTARASGRSLEEVNGFLKEQGLSLGGTAASQASGGTPRKSNDSGTDILSSIEAQLRAKIDNPADWNVQGVDRIKEFAQILAANGITDLSKIGLKTSDRQIPANTWETESGTQTDPAKTIAGRQFTYGDQTFGFLGDANSDGSISKIGGSPYIGLDGVDPNLLAWSSQGHGNVSYQLVDGPNGPQVVPKWNSSSDAKDTREAVIAALATMGGGYAAAGGFSGAAGAGAVEGAGGAGVLEGAIGSGVASSSEAAAIAAAQGVTTAEVATVATTLAQKLGTTAASVLTKLASDPSLWKAGVALVGGALANKSGGGGSPNDLAASNTDPQTILDMIQKATNTNFDKGLNASRYNVNTPDGSSAWTQDPKTGQWTNTSTLSAANQGIKDSRTAFAQQLSQWLPNAAGAYGAQAQAGANRSGIPGYQFSAGETPTLKSPTTQNITQGPIQKDVTKTAQDWSGAVQAPVANWASKAAEADPWSFDQQGADAMYRANTRYLEPQQKQAQDSLEARLGEQGFVPGTPGYDRAMRNLQDSNAQALAQARDTSIVAGRQFGDQAFDNKQQGWNQGIAGMLNLAQTGISSDSNRFEQNLQQGQFRNTAQAQDFGQDLTNSNLTRQRGLDANNTAIQQVGLNQGAGEFRNNAVSAANTTANANFTTDLNAKRNSVLDASGWLTGYNPQAPGAAQSNVPGMGTPDIASILQQYFNNNTSIANANTSASNANTAAWGQLLAAIIPSLVKG